MAPAALHDVVLVLAAHGSARDGGANAVLARHVAALGREGRFAEVRGAALVGEPPADLALAGIDAATVVVAPLFMTDGYLVREALPGRMAAAGGADGVVMLEPIGADPAIADLAIRRAAALTREQGWSAADTDLLLIAHGNSRDPASSRSVAKQAARIDKPKRFGRVRLAFLEEVPLLDDVVAALGPRTVAVGLFAGDGRHPSEDLARSLAQAPYPVPAIPAIGADPEVPGLIVDAVRARLSR